MLKKQSKIQKIRRMLKNTNIEKLKIINLKNGNKKTNLPAKNNILFINTQVQDIVNQVLKEMKDKHKNKVVIHISN